MIKSKNESKESEGKKGIRLLGYNSSFPKKGG